jgi:hypothetical protein
VTRRDARRQSSIPHKLTSLKRPCLSVDELERRLATSVMHMIHAEPCACLGALCHCDGQECIGVCESYCLINYV